MEQAFATLRNHARNHNLRLADVARDLIDGTLTTSRTRSTVQRGTTLKARMERAAQARTFKSIDQMPMSRT